MEVWVTINASTAVAVTVDDIDENSINDCYSMENLFCYWEIIAVRKKKKEKNIVNKSVSFVVDVWSSLVLILIQLSKLKINKILSESYYFILKPLGEKNISFLMTTLHELLNTRGWLENNACFSKKSIRPNQIKYQFWACSC